MERKWQLENRRPQLKYMKVSRFIGCVSNRRDTHFLLDYGYGGETCHNCNCNRIIEKLCWTSGENEVELRGMQVPRGSSVQ
jgi:hypothetical protein